MKSISLRFTRQMQVDMSTSNNKRLIQDNLLVQAKRKNGRGGKIPHHLSSISSFSEVRGISSIRDISEFLKNTSLRYSQSTTLESILSSFKDSFNKTYYLPVKTTLELR